VGDPVQSELGNSKYTGPLQVAGVQEEAPPKTEPNVAKVNATTKSVPDAQLRIICAEKLW
jgi:hypothetical protein